MKRYPRSLELRFTFPKKAEVFERLLSIEADEFYRKVRIDATSDANILVVTIRAEDSSSLRAAMNSILNWVELISEVLRDVHDERHCLTSQ